VASLEIPMPFEPNQLSSHFPKPLQWECNQTLRTIEWRDETAPTRTTRGKSPPFPMRAYALHPRIFRTGCVFCRDIVPPPQMYRTYRCHRFVAPARATDSLHIPCSG
jgi:hypothetical protein